MTQFKENIRSYAQRARADCKQIEYQLDLIIFGETEFQGGHIENIRNYLKKIEEHLLEAEELLNEKKESIL